MDFGNLILLQIDWKFLGANPPETDQLFDKYDVTGIPAILGLDSTGTELGRVLGYTSGSGQARPTS
jgi:hypothetical protein